ncbi:carbohydrate-binding module family 18 protein [Echria macrotheca]|uniref:Carbohydrate-binding module family 18 protein n=1 Tax=Echria macrotheca TaxID=438768 RepID=A0AAJ0F8K3_9PEZI|nr:carbohydrate-binding module family 18 protein [Echria macrotheca]
MAPVSLITAFVTLLLSVGVHSQGTASSCTKTATARTGDTCASLAERAGITVTQFLQSNPSVTSCSPLISGAVYCTEGKASGSPSVPAAAGSTSPSNPLTISSDGTCGGSVTCAGSRFGVCCSGHGYCGSTADYCGDGCQAGLGECGDGSVPVSSSPSPPPPSPSVETSVRTISATQTVQATVVVTRTVQVTNTVRVRPSTSVVVLTSVRPSTSVVVLTSVRPTTATIVTTSVVRATATTLRTHTVTKTQAPPPPPPKPSPLLPKTPENCQSYDEIRRRDTCRTIASRNDLSLRDFYDLNPAITSKESLLGDLLCAKPGGLLGGLLGGRDCRISCNDLWPGYYVCVST